MADTSYGVRGGSFRFEVDAALLFQLGEQLVARRSVALSELIKNAYDADATRVTVLLEDVTRPDGTIVVDDNGIGMTFEQIRDNWMRIATNDKVRNPCSPIFCRPRTGAKGIGRFATRRLASKLTLHSVARRQDGTKERVVVVFDWKHEFQAGQTLTEIPVTYERTTVSEDTATGIMLYLENARDIWSEQDIIDLQRDLVGLVNPFSSDEPTPNGPTGEYQPEPSFSLKLEIPEFPKYQGELGDQFLAAAWGILRGRCNEMGEPNYDLDIRETGQEHLSFVPEGTVFKGLSGAHFRIHFFVYKSDYLDDSPFSVRDAQKMGREQGGIRIYLDRFRVFPYGDPGDDWLKLDVIRAGRTRRLVVPTQELQQMEESLPGRPYLLTPGNNQVFGAVAISRQKHPGIEINVSRERLVDTETFEQLRRFVQLGIYWMTIQYARVRNADAERRKSQESDRGPSVPEVIEQVQARVLSARELSSETQNELIQVLNYAKERAQATEEAHIGELSMLRVLSSTGAMVAMLNHQLRAVIDGIRGIHVDLVELHQYVLPVFQPVYDEIVARIQIWRETVEQQVSQLGFLLGADARLRRRRLALREVVGEVTSPLSLYMRDFGIEFLNEVPANLRTPPMYKAELYAVLLHIYTNALKAVSNREERRIAARAFKEGDEVRIHMLDTGVGVEAGQREEVFKAFVTTSVPDPILGVGTGLGLKVVRDMLEAYGGTAQFVDTEKPWRTCIEIVLPGSI